MAGQGMALMQFLGMGNMLGMGNVDGPMGRGGAYQEDTQAMSVRPSPDGKQARVMFSTMDPSPMGALARENFRRLGIDNPYVGRLPVSLTAKVDGNNLIFDINGKERSVTREALMDARGNELSRLLGVNSFMDFAATKGNAANNAAYSTAGLQQTQVQDAGTPPKGNGATATSPSVGPGSGTPGQDGGRPAAGNVATTQQQALPQIPTLQTGPFGPTQYIPMNPGMMQGYGQQWPQGPAYQNPWMPFIPQGPQGGQFGMPQAQQFGAPQMPGPQGFDPQATP